MIQTIEVVVSPTGETRIETKGFAGTSCQEASRGLESALGAKVREQLTADYFRQAASTTQNVGQEGGAS